ncbi:MAG: FAD:protein FMN transferase [Actinobacteria bacterium]|nr:FAD:protein FMN transferase [Actinomycetota bacterium]
MPRVDDRLPGGRWVEQIMGLPILVDVRDDVDEDQVSELFDWFRHVDRAFSTYIDDSEISRLNRGELDLDDADPEVCSVLARCDELREETDGYFDVRAAAAETIDPSGLVKGWSVDRAALIAERHGWRNYAINAGGDMRLHGSALPDASWRVGIQHPTLRQKIAGVVRTNDLAVATSGNYARGEHVFDPHTHQPPTGVFSVTITGPVLATADAYATAALAMGTAGSAWTARLASYEAMTILADETVLFTPGFPRAA